MSRTERHRQWAIENREKIAAYQRSYYPEWRLKNFEHLLEYNRLWRLDNPDHVRAAVQKARAKYPERTRAHQVISSAIRTGKLKPQPCRVCGSLVSHVHHEDYSKPLDVDWLCAAHHRAVHRKVLTDMNLPPISDAQTPAVPPEVHRKVQKPQDAASK
jgi:hypothetical protein